MTISNNQDGSIKLSGSPATKVYVSSFPFNTGSKPLNLEKGQSLADIAEKVGEDCVILLNGRKIPKEKWKSVKPKPNGNVIQIYTIPKGGGGGGKKNPLSALLGIAVAFAAPYLAGAILGSGIIASTAAGASLITKGLTAAIGIVGKLAISALAPAPKQSSAVGRTPSVAESKTMFVEGARNALDPFGVVPVNLGTNRMVPNQAARPFSEVINGKQQGVRQLFTWGFGQKLIVSDLKMGETPISDFTGVSIQHRLNGDLKEGTGLFPSAVFQEDFNIKLDTNFVTRTTQTNVDEAIVDFIFPQGLVRFNEEAKRKTLTADLEIQFSPAGQNNWSAGIVRKYTAAQREPLLGSVRIVFTNSGQYDIRVRRLNAESTSDQWFDSVNLSSIKTVRNDPVVLEEQVNGTAIRILASDQLSGFLDQVNAVIQSVVLDYNATTDEWTEQSSSNPASLFRYVLQNWPNTKPVPDEKLDLDKLEEWHIYCQERGYSYNRVIDYETSVLEVLRDIASAGMASLDMVDGKYSVVIDDVKPVVTQIVTPRNSWDYRAEINYVEEVHAFRVSFRNRENGFNLDERVVYVDGYNQSNATIFETLELPFCIETELAYKFARRYLASAFLRPETHSFMMDFEYLQFKRGDRIKLAHDVPIVGFGDGRIKSVTIVDNLVTGFTIDDTVTLPFTGTFYVRIRLEDGTYLYEPVNGTIGGQSEFTFITPFSDDNAPQIGDLCYFVQAGDELDLIVTRIEPQADLTARVSAVDYSPAIFNTDNEPIPQWQSVVATPLEFIRPQPPMFVSAQSNDAVMQRNIDGSFTTRGVFTFTNPNEPDMQMEVQVRSVGSTQFYTPSILERTPERVVLTGLDDDTRYDIHFRYRRLNGGVFSIPYQLNNYLFEGNILPPDDVEQFRIAIADNNVAILTWSANDDIDLSHYEIRFSSLFSGATWDTAQKLEDLIYENRITIPFRSGTYLIKAVDIAGNKSVNETAIITADFGAIQNVVEILTESPTFNGTKDNTQLEGSSLILADETEIGYYYFEDVVDLGEKQNSFIKSAIVAGGAFVNNIFDVENIFDMEDVFGAGGGDIFYVENIFDMEDVFGIGTGAWEVDIEYSVTNDDPEGSPEWSEWESLTNGFIEFRAIRFRVRMQSFQLGISPSVTFLQIEIDMPDRIEDGEDIDVGIEGVEITYPQSFKNNPAVLITIQDGQADDKIEFVFKNSSGFKFKVYNEGISSYVARTFDFISSGYGRIT